MSVHSNQRKKRRDSQMKFKTFGNNEEFLERITKTLYYAELPSTERFSLPLSELAVELYSEVKLGRSLERLRIEDASEISRNACISPCSLVLALLYLEQLKTSNPAYVDKVSPSELFVISLMVASKFMNDSGEEDDVLNSEWAASSGLSSSDINKLEKEFLKAIDWKVFVKNSEFWNKLHSIETKVALNEGKKRGWFSYSELEVLLDQLNAYLLAQAVFTVSAVCLASYAAGMLTVIGSTMMATQLMYIPSCHRLWTEMSVDVRIPPHLEPWNDSALIPDICSENSPLINCSENGLDDHGLLEKVSNTIQKHEMLSLDNISTFYKNLLAPVSYDLIRFPQYWKPPSLYIFSE